MTIPAIGAVSSALPTLPTSPARSIGSAQDASPATGSSAGSDFAALLNKGLNSVQAAQTNADNLAVQAATGDLTDIQDYTIAATQASIATSLATAIRTKGVDAFNQIMGMQA